MLIVWFKGLVVMRRLMGHECGTVMNAESKRTTALVEAAVLPPVRRCVVS